MFGVSIWELLLVGLILFLVVGPQKLPGLAKQVGQGLKDLRKSLNEIKGSVDTDDEFVKAVRDARQSVAEAREAVRSMFDDEDEPAPMPDAPHDPAPKPVPKGRKMVKPARDQQGAASDDGDAAGGGEAGESAAPVESEVFRADQAPGMGSSPVPRPKPKPAPSSSPAPRPKSEAAPSPSPAPRPKSEAAPEAPQQTPGSKTGRRMIRPGKSKD